jgi:hypothetical protein
VADAQPKGFARLGPFTGLDERNDASATTVPVALNVDFGPEGVTRRPGREVMLSPGLPIAAVFRHVSSEGDTSLLVIYEDDQGAGVGHTGVNLGIVNENAGSLTDVPFPAGYNIDNDLGHGAGWDHACFNGHSIIASPSGIVFDFDGTTLSLLGALQGDDAAKGLLGAKTYLAAPPSMSRIAVWRNRLVGAAGNTIAISETDGSANVPASAPVGGPNVWPSETWFDLITDQADRVGGLTVYRDRLAVLATRTAHIVDEDEVAPYARQQDGEHGVLAPRSVQVINQGVVFLSHGAVCIFDGQTVQEVSGPLRETMTIINWTAAQNAVSAVLRRKHEYRLWVPVYGRTGNGLCIVWNFRENTWRLYAGLQPWLDDAEVSLAGALTAPKHWNVRCALSFVTQEGDEFLFTGDGTDLVREDVTEDDGTAHFPAYFATGVIGNGSAREYLSGVRVECKFDGSPLDVWVLPEGETVAAALRRPRCQRPRAPRRAGDLLLRRGLAGRALHPPVRHSPSAHRPPRRRAAPGGGARKALGGDLAQRVGAGRHPLARARREAPPREDAMSRPGGPAETPDSVRLVVDQLLQDAKGLGPVMVGRRWRLRSAPFPTATDPDTLLVEGFIDGRWTVVKRLALDGTLT